MLGSLYVSPERQRELAMIADFIANHGVTKCVPFGPPKSELPTYHKELPFIELSRGGYVTLPVRNSVYIKLKEKINS